MKKYSISLLVLLVSLLVISCNPSDDNSTNNTTSNSFSKNFGNAVSRDFIGQVVNENNYPLSGVSVKIGTKTALTDVNGVFVINNASVYERFAYIIATKSGYIDGSRSMVPTAGKNNLKIMMIPNTPIQTIQSGVASEVLLPNGTKVNFDGAFQDESGSVYSGSVQVSMFHLEASNENISTLMPGMLYAEDANGKEKVLETYGMMNVELKGESGQKLQIASGHSAQITMAIDNGQLATAPNSIPLWHFDEVNGYWKEEGSAQREGNNYVGSVSHFSWWNCDYPHGTVSLTINVVDTNGNPIPSAMVGVSLQQNGFYYYSLSNSLGVVNGLVPANQVLYLSLHPDYGCGTIAGSSQIGPLSSDTTTTLTVDLGNNTTLMTGSLLNCDSQAVANGYVKLFSNNNLVIIPLDNGGFSYNTSYCTTNFSLRGYNLDTNTVSEFYNGSFTQGTTNVGNLLACTDNACNFNLEGNFTLVVTRDDGQSATFPNEIIQSTGVNTYHTSTTANYSPGQLQGENGFSFNVNNCQIISVPTQNLNGVYSNLVRGVPNSNTIDGQIIDANTFQIVYQLGYTNNNVWKTYTAVYTRNQ